MAINLLDIAPHKVSTDLSEYITFIYGAPKTGKTTFATQMPKHLLLAFEKGYNALPGVMAQDVTTWGEMKQILRELKKPEVREIYQSVIIDTVDIASTLCQKYICQQLGIENIGDGGFSTNGWDKYKKEFEDTFRTLTMLGYAVVFISHEKRVKNSKTEVTTICPSTQSSALSIIENMADIYGYAHQVRGENGESKVILTLRTSEDIACGGRFKYIDNEIDFTYDSLAKALKEAIAREAKVTEGKYITEQRQTDVVVQEFDYDSLRGEFEGLVGELMGKDQAYYGPRITQIVDKYLGKGKKVSDTTRDQAELISLVNEEIKEDLLNK